MISNTGSFSNRIQHLPMQANAMAKVLTKKPEPSLQAMRGSQTYKVAHHSVVAEQHQKRNSSSGAFVVPQMRPSTTSTNSGSVQMLHSNKENVLKPNSLRVTAQANQQHAFSSQTSEYAKQKAAID